MTAPDRRPLEIDWQSSTRTLHVKGVFDGRALRYVRSCFSAPALRPAILDLSAATELDDGPLAQLARDLLSLDSGIELRGLQPRHVELLRKAVGDAVDAWLPAPLPPWKRSARDS
jgi:hypothetical protein